MWTALVVNYVVFMGNYHGNVKVELDKGNRYWIEVEETARWSDSSFSTGRNSSLNCTVDTRQWVWVKSALVLVCLLCALINHSEC